MKDQYQIKLTIPGRGQDGHDLLCNHAACELSRLFWGAQIAETCAYTRIDGDIVIVPCSRIEAYGILTQDLQDAVVELAENIASILQVASVQLELSPCPDSVIWQLEIGG